MKQRYIKRIVANEADVQYFVDKGYQKEYAEMFSARGLTRDNFDEFFGGASKFHSPFEIPNMREAVEIISYVMEIGGRVLIYGDYDADGLTASSILSLFFTDNGIENNVLIPTRDEGYGLHADKVIRAFKRNFYDLVITVDCGISNADEVEKIVEELGVEVIVTDHHELPDALPNCICVNPKMGYSCPFLAGAGVAWKLVEALAGRDVATKYSALAAIGTIGDIMPMRDENRSIIKLGLANFNHKNLRKLAELSRCPDTLSASDVAMKLVPKINAAGRVGHPEVALEFLLGRDKLDTAICDKLLSLNDERKRRLDDIVAEADGMCDLNVIYSERMVFLFSDKWSHGLLGIVASRYKEKYNLPAIVMTLDGDNYVGSARGIDSLDLFQIFSRCSQYLVEYGGHKASVGFSVSRDKLGELRKALVSVLEEFDKSLFTKAFYYDIDISADTKLADIMDLSCRLQPMSPQDKIICRARDVVKTANSFGKEGAHLSLTLSSGLEVKGFFKYGKYASFIRNGANVDMLFSLEIDGYTKNICGIIEDITLDNSVNFDEFYRLNLLKNFIPTGVEFVPNSKVAEILARDWTLAIFDDYDTYLECAQKYDFLQYYVDIFFDNSVSTQTVVISPLNDYNFSRYTNIVYFCAEDIYRHMPSGAFYVCCDKVNADLYALELNRDVCLTAFKAIRSKNKFDSVKGVYDKYLLGKITYAQYIVSLRVFEELDIITIEDEYTVVFNQTDKQDLSKSSIFRCFNKGVG